MEGQSGRGWRDGQCDAVWGHGAGCSGMGLRRGRDECAECPYEYGGVTRMALFGVFG